MSKPPKQQTFGGVYVENGGFGFAKKVEKDLDLHLGDTKTDTRNILTRAAFNAKEREHIPSCLKGTRQDVLTQIKSWADGNVQERMLWLTGMGGIGKTTIALTIARFYRKRKHLGSSFFFERGDGDLSSAQDFASTISSQLEAISIPLKNHIVKAASNRSLCDWGLSYQWEKLVMEPLSLLPSEKSRPPIILVIDSLDQCENKNDAGLVIKLLAELTALENIHIRVFITSTSKPSDLPIAVRNSQGQREIVLQDIGRSATEDIAAYYRTHLSTIIGKDGKSEKTIQNLVGRSHGLFIHAVTSCNFIRKGDKMAEERLALILKTGSPDQRPQKALDDMYATVLRRSLVTGLDSRELQNLRARFKLVLGSLANSFDKLSVTDLAVLLSVPEERLLRLLKNLDSIVDRSGSGKDQSIRLIHPSLREFLNDPERNLDNTFQINVKDAHKTLFHCCMDILESQLKRNMCDFRYPGKYSSSVSTVTLSRMIPCSVQYACRYWVDHLRLCEVSDKERTRVATFFQTNYLFWLEVLAWTGYLPQALKMMDDLKETMILKVSQDRGGFFRSLSLRCIKNRLRKPAPMRERSAPLPLLLQDAWRFIHLHGSAIQSNPLQAYCSGLIFSPESSLMRNLHASHSPSWIKQRPIISEGWSPSLRLINIESGIQVSAFSPDGSRVAISSQDNSLSMVALASGTVRSIMRSSNTPVKGLSFSPDGLYLLCNSSEQSSASFELIDFNKEKSDVVLHPNGQSILAVGFLNQRILVLSQPNEGHTAHSGDCTLAKEAFPLERQTASSHAHALLWYLGTKTTLAHLCSDIQQAEFSPNGKFLFVARTDGASQLIDTGTLRLQTVKGNAAKFSSSDNTVAITTVNSGECPSIYHFTHEWKRKWILDRPADLTDLAFSPDGKLLAVSSNCKIDLYNTNTGQVIRTWGKYSWKAAVVFSPDSSLLAWSCGDTECFVIWKLSTLELIQKLERPGGMAPEISLEIAFAGGRKILSSIADKHIRLWDASGGTKMVQEDLFSAPQNLRMAFSQDGLLVATTYGRDLEIWSVAESTCISTFTMCQCFTTVDKLSWSNHSQLLGVYFRHELSCSKVDTFRLWDVTKRTYHDLKKDDHSPMVAMAFSCKDSRIISASMNRMIQIWDTVTGHKIDTIESPSPILSLAIIPASHCLAVGTELGIETFTPGNAFMEDEASASRLRDIKNAGMRCGPVTRLVFSQNGQIFAYSCGSRIWIYDFESKIHQQIPKSYLQQPLGFSSDGKLLAARLGSEIHIWSIGPTDFSPWKKPYDIPGDHHFSFSPCGNFITTEFGTFPLTDKGEGKTTAISVRGPWIMNGNEYIIKMPEEYRRVIVYAAGSFVVFNGQKGRQVLEFDNRVKWEF